MSETHANNDTSGRMPTAFIPHGGGPWPVLEHWQQAPAARACHPREEHLLPLMVVAGAAEHEPGAVTWSGSMAGFRISAHQFG